MKIAVTMLLAALPLSGGITGEAFTSQNTPLTIESVQEEIKSAETEKIDTLSESLLAEVFGIENEEHEGEKRIAWENTPVEISEETRNAFSLTNIRKQGQEKKTNSDIDPEGEETEEEEIPLPPLAEYEIYPHSGFKSFEHHDGFNPEYRQYELQTAAYTDGKGLRMIEGRYAVAIGSYFDTQIGQWFDLMLENGNVIPCFMGDLKADEHTDSMNIYTVHSNCCSEFIVDYNALDKDVKLHGDVSYAYEGWNSPVVKVTVYGENF